MTEELTVVMLAGALRPSPLKRELGIPAIFLPVGRRGTLLDSWLDAIDEAAPGACVRIVVNSEDDVREARRITEQRERPDGCRLDVTTEPASWRGPGGLVRDLTEDLAPENKVMVIEANCFPFVSLAQVLETLDEGTDGVVGATPAREPAGVLVLDRGALEAVPRIGFYDIKEQLLPALHAAGRRVRVASVADRVLRVRDRSSYLQAVRAGWPGARGEETQIRCSSSASVAPSARIAGCCVIEPEAVIEEGALVHDSVVLAGAVVGRGSVVSRSVAAPFAQVPAKSRVVDQIVPRREGDRRDRIAILRRENGAMPVTQDYDGGNLRCG